MLKQRLLTGVLLAAVVFVVMLVLPLSWAFGFGLLMMVLCADEWLKLAEFNDTGSRALYALMVLISCAVIGGGLLGTDFWLGLGVLLWLVLSTWLLSVDHRQAVIEHQPKPVVALVGVLVLCLAFYALVWLRQATDSALLLLYVIGIPVVADSAAYFSGKRLGRVKLAPSISPGKTREGAMGGLIGVALYAVLLGGLFSDDMGRLSVLLITLVAASVSVLGDLFESSLKRRSEIKDSGALLPGHGGMLDRLDSLLAAAPVFAALFALMR